MLMTSSIRAIVFISVALAFLLPQAGAFAEPEPPAPIKVGANAPNFKAKDLEGREIDLHETAARRKVVLLAFWGVRCGDCIAEIPTLNEAHRKWGGAGLQILGVNVDGVPFDVLKKQVPSLPDKPEYPLVADPAFQIADGYKLQAAPLTVGISSMKKVVFVHSGFQEGDEKALNEFLASAMAGTEKAEVSGAGKK